jgi:hypothetical protein
VGPWSDDGRAPVSIVIQPGDEPELNSTKVLVEGEIQSSIA